MSFFKSREQEGKTGPARGGWYQWEGEDKGKGVGGEYGGILCTHA
jgi:hypothetical protein